MLDDLRSLVTYDDEGHIFWSPHVVEETKLLLFCISIRKLVTF